MSIFKRIADSITAGRRIDVVYDPSSWHCNSCGKGDSNSRDSLGDAARHNRAKHRSELPVSKFDA